MFATGSRDGEPDTLQFWLVLKSYMHTCVQRRYAKAGTCANYIRLGKWCRAPDSLSLSLSLSEPLADAPRQTAISLMNTYESARLVCPHHSKRASRFVVGVVVVDVAAATSAKTKPTRTLSGSGLVWLYL